MPNLYNHGHFPVEEYAEHSPAKYLEMVVDGGLKSGQVLGCTSSEDVIQLDPRLHDDYPYMVEHFASAGLATADEVIWDTRPEVANDFPEFELSVYRFCEEIHAVRPDRKRLKATAIFNNKNYFISYCQKRGFPSPPTLLSGDFDEEFIDDIEYPVFVKAARSSAGISVYRASSSEELETSLGLVGSQFQIQKEVADSLAFMNVQYRRVGGTLLHLATTEQILEGFAHIGNRYPAVYDPRPITDRLARKAIRFGLNDVFAFDVAVTPENMKIIECNARWNGSTYPTVIANRLGVDEWTARHFPTSLEHPEQINLEGLNYNPDSRAGAIIFFSGRMATNNTVHIFIAGPEEVSSEIKQRLAERLMPRHKEPIAI